MSITLELPKDLESTLIQKARNQGLTLSDFLIQLVRREADSNLYTKQEIEGFMEADAITPELSAKVQRLLGT